MRGINLYKWGVEQSGSGIDLLSFIMAVEVTAGSLTFTIPTTGAGYNYNISTSDGQTFVGEVGNKTITFPAAGLYDI